MHYALILAGGSGTRAGGPLPKQFMRSAGKRMIWWSVDAFKAFDPGCRIVLVLHPDFLANWDTVLSPDELERNRDIIRVAGGSSRIESVKNGLEAVRKLEAEAPEGEAYIFIHDAARPYVTPDLIARGKETVSPGVGSVPVVPLVDSIRKVGADGATVAADRADFVSVQTPQVFRFADISGAYSSLEGEDGLTDDASVAEKYGLKINTYQGDSRNYKITNPADLEKWT